MPTDFFEKGWCSFAKDPVLLKWVESALPIARQAVASPENTQWLRCGGTWFVGVNALENANDGSLAGEVPLAGQAIDFIADDLQLPDIAWDRAQVSVMYPGYPQPSSAEMESAFKYRRDRDAAHVDGLHPVGPARRRHINEHHGFILGIPLVEVSTEASPVAVWEGSHELIRTAFQERFKDHESSGWSEIDVTETYHAARREIFSTCQRITLTAQPGEAYLIHRLALHGVAPWGQSAEAEPDGRMICYFRPETPDPKDWLFAP